MIIDGIINIFLGLLTTLVNLLPTTPAPPDLAGMVGQAFGYDTWAYSFVREWFPLNELGMALVAMLTFMVAIHAFRLAGWLLALIHVGGTDV